MQSRPTTIPAWVAAHAAKVNAAHQDPVRFAAVFQESAVPSLLVDDHRRYLDANAPARALLGLSLGEIRRLRIDDLTPPYLSSRMEANWGRLMQAGTLVSTDMARPEGSFLGVNTFAIANVLPGRHLVSFAPREWPDGEVTPADLPPPARVLTPREVQVLELAAGGFKGPDIAVELVLTPATVRTHFTNIYRKLDVGDRAAAVAKAMRIGLIR
jgi:DNA-binding CsgD family transcriptional regulator